MSTKRNSQNGSSDTADTGNIPTSYIVDTDAALIAAWEENAMRREIDASENDAQESDVSDVGIDYSAFAELDDYTPAQANDVAAAMNDAGLQQAYRVYETSHNVAWELSPTFSSSTEFHASFYTLTWGMNERIRSANEDLPEAKRKDEISQNSREYTFVRVVTELHAHRGANNAYRISTYAVHTSGAFFKIPSRIVQTHDVVTLENAGRKHDGTFGDIYAMSLIQGHVVNAMSTAHENAGRIGIEQAGKGYTVAYVKVSAIAARKAYAMVASGTRWHKNPLARFINRLMDTPRVERTAF